MECRKCKVEKPPNEFAPENVSDECEHPSLLCLRCIVKNIKEASVCPYPACKQTAKFDEPRIKWFQAILDDMFREYSAEDDDVGVTPASVHPLLFGGTLTVTLLTGESIVLPYNPNLTILQLKQNIKNQMDIAVGKQKLLYGEKEMTEYNASNQMTKLIDFNVKPNSTICLVVLLFAIPDTFNDVVFDLFWGYPMSGRDYLDASCLMFQGTTCTGICDFRRSRTNVSSAVTHSGDVMDDYKSIGHHTINVRLQDIPSNITHLFFTLSAWSSPNISRYPNPSLKFYEKASPGKDLCKTTFQHANYSQAVVMCSMSRGAHGKWEIYESGKLSAGNANNYSPIQSTIQSLIMQGF